MRIAYWSTSSLEPQYEAVSLELWQLARRFPGSWIFSISPHYWLRFSWKKGYGGVHSSMYPLARLAVPMLEERFDVNHVYGDLTPWLYHKALRLRPIIHTVTQSHERPLVEFLERCSAVVVQAESTQRSLAALGVASDKLLLWYPGVDLERFRPKSSGRPSGKPRLLFAAAPRSQAELAERGVYLLLETARLHDDIEFRFLYRRWSSGYTSLKATLAAIEKAGLANVEITSGTVEDMASEYARNHFTVIPFLDARGGKECPNSALESLASGVPVLVSEQCPLAELVHRTRCGIVFRPDPQSLARAVEQGLHSWEALSSAARVTAEKELSLVELSGRYARLYDRVC